MSANYHFETIIAIYFLKIQIIYFGANNTISGQVVMVRYKIFEIIVMTGLVGDDAVLKICEILEIIVNERTKSPLLFNYYILK